MLHNTNNDEIKFKGKILRTLSEITTKIVMGSDVSDDDIRRFSSQINDLDKIDKTHRTVIEGYDPKQDQDLNTRINDQVKYLLSRSSSNAIFFELLKLIREKVSSAPKLDCAIIDSYEAPKKINSSNETTSSTQKITTTIQSTPVTTRASTAQTSSLTDENKKEKEVKRALHNCRYKADMTITEIRDTIVAYLEKNNLNNTQKENLTKEIISTFATTLRQYIETTFPPTFLRHSMIIKLHNQFIVLLKKLDEQTTNNYGNKISDCNKLENTRFFGMCNKLRESVLSNFYDLEFIYLLNDYLKTLSSNIAAKLNHTAALQKSTQSVPTSAQLYTSAPSMKRLTHSAPPTTLGRDASKTNQTGIVNKMDQQLANATEGVYRLLAAANSMWNNANSPQLPSHAAKTKSADNLYLIKPPR